MVSQRGFDTIPGFSGEADGFTDCTFKFKSVLRLEAGFEKYLLHIEGLVEKPTKQTVPDYFRTTGDPADW